MSEELVITHCNYNHPIAKLHHKDGYWRCPICHRRAFEDYLTEQENKLKGELE